MTGWWQSSPEQRAGLQGVAGAVGARGVTLRAKGAPAQVESRDGARYEEEVASRALGDRWAKGFEGGAKTAPHGPMGVTGPRWELAGGKGRPLFTAGDSTRVYNWCEAREPARRNGLS